MKLLITFIKNYPFEVVAVLLISWMIFLNPAISLGNLFLLIAVLFSQYLLITKNKFLRLLSIVILLSAVTAYYFIHRSGGEYIFAVLNIIAVIIFAYCSIKFGSINEQKAIIKKILTLGLIIIFLIPFLITFFNNYFIQQEKERLKSEHSNFEDQIDQILKKDQSTAVELSEDIFINQLLASRSYSDLSEYSQNLMLIKNLDYMAYCDQNGNVVSRPHNAKFIGDECKNIFLGWPDKNINPGIVYEKDSSYLLSAAFINNQNPEDLSGIIVGQKLKNSLFDVPKQTEAIILAYKNKVIDISNSQFSEVDFSNLFSTSDLSSTKDIYDLGGLKYLVFKNNLGSSEASLILINKFNYGQNIIRIVFLITFLISLLGIIFFRIRYPHRLFAASVKANQKYLFWNFAIKYQLQLEIILEAMILLFSIWLMSYYSTLLQIKVIGDNFQLKTLELPDARPSIWLDTTSYVNFNTPALAKLKTNNLSPGTSTISTTVTYNPLEMTINSIEANNSICDSVYDKTIDNKVGYINFSCISRNIDQSELTSFDLLTIEIIPKKLGFLYLNLDDSYTKISGSKGNSANIIKSTNEGECILVIP